jgi:hypothetical protein
VNLPFLADSINEGTIAEFVKSKSCILSQRKENGLSKMKQSLTSKLIKSLLRSRALNQESSSSSMSTLETAWMLESHSSTLIQKVLNQQVKLQSNKLKNNNPNIKLKRKKLKSQRPKNNNLKPSQPLNPNHPRIQDQKFKHQESMSEPTSKENKPENPCPDSDKESPKDLNKHKITTLS